MSKVIFMVGFPFAGKSTIGRLLKERLNFAYIGLGEILRRSEVVDVDHGNLVSSQIVFDILNEEISKINKSKIIVVDGYPRSMENVLKYELEKPSPLCVIYLSCEKENLESRMRKRILSGIRKDDTFEIAQKRITICQENTPDMLRYYTERGKLYIVNSNYEINVVLNQVCKSIAHAFNANEIPYSDGSILTVEKKSDEAILPFKTSSFAAGFDIFSAMEQVILPQTSVAINTDICVQPPPNCYIRIAERSGLALHHNLRVCAGVIDSDYFLPIRVILYNHGNEPFFVSKRMRIAQIIITRCLHPTVVEGEIDHPQRSGFGSTGLY